MSQAAGELWAACDSPGPASRYLTDAAMGDLFARRGGGGAGREKWGWENRKESGRGGGWEGGGEKWGCGDREQSGRGGGGKGSGGKIGMERRGNNREERGRDGGGGRGRGREGEGQTRTDGLTDSSYARIKV